MRRDTQLSAGVSKIPPRRPYRPGDYVQQKEPENDVAALASFQTELCKKLNCFIEKEKTDRLYRQTTGDVEQGRYITHNMDDWSSEDWAAAKLFLEEVKDENAPKEPKPNEEAKHAPERQPLIQRDEYFDKKLRRWRLVKPKKDPRRTVELEEHVLLVRRIFDDRMEYQSTEIDVKGQILRCVLRNIFWGASGFPMTNVKHTLDPMWFLWAKPHLEQLSNHCIANNQQDELFEIDSALLFVRNHFPDLCAELAELSEYSRIAFGNLWSIFPPNTLVYGRSIPFRIHRVWRLISGAVRRQGDGTLVFEIDAEFAEADGRCVGTSQKRLLIPRFEGTVAISELPYTPLYLLGDRDDIWDSILDRTRHQLGFLDHAFVLQAHSGEGIDNGGSRFHFRGRVIIDPIKYRAVMQSPLVPELQEFPKTTGSLPSRQSHDGKLLNIEDLLGDRECLDSLKASKRQTDILTYPYGMAEIDTDDDKPLGRIGRERIEAELCDSKKILFTGMVYGFCLGDACWGGFLVQKLQDVVFDTNMLGALVMNRAVLDSMSELIQLHSARTAFDDFVKGKGRGLVGLLCGKPGLGKTFTAEAIAETACRPLYMVSSGALGSGAVEIDQKLTQVLDLCAHWKAVLLLDEADVFLARRKLEDLERNAIVAVFLRELEYYPGVMVLTTNQPEIIDDAFLSRIHFCYRYPALGFDARRQIWSNFIDKVTASNELIVTVDAAGLDELAKKDCNGRQIKNAMSIAVTLARGKTPKELNTQDILNTAQRLQNFDFSKPAFSDDSESSRTPNVSKEPCSLQNGLLASNSVAVKKAPRKLRLGSKTPTSVPPTPAET